MTFNWNYVLSLLNDAGFWWATWTAIKLSLLTWGYSIVLGFIPAPAKQSSRGRLLTPTRLYIWLFRSMSLLVLLTFVYNMPQALPSFALVLNDPLRAGLLMTVFNEAVYVAEIHRGGLLSIPRGQNEIVRALELRYAGIQWRVIIPQVLHIVLPVLVNEYTAIVGLSSLVPVISLIEILIVSQQLYSQNFLVMETTTIVAFCYIFIVMMFDFLLRRLENYPDVTQRDAARPVDAEMQRLASVRRLAMAHNVAQSHRPALRASKLRRVYNNVKILGAASPQVQPGEVVPTVGPSGSGKATLIRLLSGLEQIDNGEIQTSGQPLTHLDRQGQQKPRFMENAEHRLNIDMVFQSFNLFPHLIASNNLLLAPRYHHLVSDAKSCQHACELLHKVGTLEYVWKYPHQLSGGQQRRVVITRALMMRPQIMLSDEPTSALDLEKVNEVLQVIKSLAREDITMVIVTHEMDLTFKVSGRVVFMEKGRVVCDDTPQVMCSG